MNKIFKTVWNAVRRCIVAVNEAVTSTAQSTVSATSATSAENKALAPTPFRSYKQTALALVVGAVLCLQFGSADAAYNLIVNEGETQTISDPNLTIANAGEEGRVDSKGTLTIQGGDYFAYGIYINASGEGSNGTILNSGEGTLAILGGAGGDAYGICFNAVNGGTGTIINTNSGTLTIQGGSDFQDDGVDVNASGDGSTGTISNTSEGTLTIQGGNSSGGYSFGIRRNAVNGGIGTISNTNSGTLTIQGGTGSYAHGISINASGAGSTGTISNSGLGNLTIQGGISSNAYGIEINASGAGSIGTISNSGLGNLTIQGGTSSDAHGIDINASGAGSIGTISNTGSGTLTILGGDSYYTYAINDNASNGGTGTISNDGSGTLKIQGSSSYEAVGLGTNAFGAGAQGTIRNTGSGTLTIEGGSYDSAHGIYYNASSGGTGIIENSGTEASVLTIRGGSYNGYPDLEVVHGIYRNAGTNSQGSIINSGAGTLNIEGGTGDYSAGLYSNASGEGAQGKIQNTGSGAMTISGGSASRAAGIYTNAADGGIGLIENSGSNVLTIKGGIYSTNFNAQGAGAHGITTNAGANSQGSIINSGSGTLYIEGGSGYYAVGLYYNANDEGSTGTISNTGEGTLIIRGTGGTDAFGIRFNAFYGGTGIIENTGSGDLKIQAGLDTGSNNPYGMKVNAYGTGSTGTIENSGSGTLTIEGGEGFTPAGLETNAASGGTGVISNSDLGQLTIRGGQDGPGIGTNASSNSQGTITNTGGGTLLIEGAGSNGIDSVASGTNSVGVVSNLGDGKLEIISGSRSHGIGSVADENGNGSILNAGTGELTIRGTGYYAIYFVSKDSGSEGTISNTGEGALTIIGAEDDTGIDSVAYDGGSATIRNTGAGTLTIQAHPDGDRFSRGIGTLAMGENSQGRLINGPSGTLNIFGNVSNRTYGIGGLANKWSDETGPVTAIVENSGIMNLNTNAISYFGGNIDAASVTVTNKATGTVNAEAGAIFENGTTTTTEYTPIDIAIYTPETGMSTAQLESYQASQTTTTESWKLKDDWANYSVWEDGGKLVITDIADGTTDAEQIKSAFEEKFGTGTSVTFTGTGTSTARANNESGEIVYPDFTVSHVNELITGGKLTDGAVVTSESLNMGNTALTVGSADTDTFKQNIGFKGVDDASSITVKDGKQLTLMGSQVAMAVALRTSEATALPVITDAAVDLKNGTLRVGIDALSTTQGSFTNTVTTDAKSTVNVENAVAHFADIQGEGALSVGEKSTVSVDSIDVKTIGNKGVLTTKDIAGATQITNEGTATFGNVRLDQQGNIANYKDASITAGDVTVGVGAFLTNATGGTFTFDSMTMNGTLRNNGTLQNKEELLLAASGTTQLNGSIKGNRLVFGAAQKTLAKALAQPATNSDADGTYEVNGEIYQKELAFNSGAVNVNKDATLAGEELAGGIVNSTVTVDADGTFAFSFNENQLKDALEELKVSTDGKAVAVLSESLSFGETGSLTIGSATGGGTLNLGSDALLYYTGDAMNADDSVTLKVDEGATAVFAKTDGWGRYYLMTGLDADSMTEAGKLAVVDKDGEAVETAVSDKGLYVQQGTMNILDKDASYGLSNNINAILDGDQNTASEFADVAFLSKAVSAKNGADAANRLEQVASEAGSMAETARLAMRAQDAVAMRALTMPASGLWAELVTGKFEADGFDAGKTSSGYEADTYGIMAGLDVAVGQSWTFGAAFNYAESDIEASSSDTKNDFESYGFSLYAGKAFESGLRLSASVGYSKGSSEVTQKNLSLVKADIDTSAWVVGARAAYTLGMSKHSAITPYIGVDAVWLKQDAFTAKLNGADAFDYASADETFVRLPVGVRADWAARTNETTAWSAFADLSVAPQFGGTEADAEVTGVHTHATDSSSFTYADDYVASLKLGGSVRMNRVNLELDYGASMGDVREISHEFSAKAKFVF